MVTPPFTHELSRCLQGNQISKGLFWDSLICSTDLYVYLCTDTTLIWFTIGKVCTFKVCSNIFRFKFISYWKLVFLVTIHFFFCILLCWSWNSNTLATSCEELTHWKRPWCWEGLGAGGEGDDRGGDGWMASPTQWTWVWVNSKSWRLTGRPSLLQSMGSQRVRHNWTTELNWTELNWIIYQCSFSSKYFHI